MIDLLLYIDPGTGGLLISAVIGFFVSLAYTARGAYYSVINYALGAGKQADYDFTGQIVLFSESKSYWTVYAPVVEGLIARKQKFTYLSADPEDPGLQVVSPFMEVYCLENMRRAIHTMNRLKAGVCILTTPQLDVIALKKSADVQHYVYLNHSATDVHALKKFGLDYFDSVMCANTAQMESIRTLEQVRGTHRKQLLKTGCTYYDVFKPQPELKGDAVLLAPTWGDRTFFKKHGLPMIADLLDGGHKIIFRPHPQSWISDKPLMDEVEENFGSHPMFMIDKAPSGEAAISQSKVLICDVTSGMIYDVAFCYRKPVIAVRHHFKDGGYESATLAKESASADVLRDVGSIVEEADVGRIADIVSDSTTTRITESIIDRHVFHFRRAGSVAAEQIIEIHKQLH